VMIDLAKTWRVFMGGHGSGWKGSKKATVESSLVLSASALVRKKALVAGARDMLSSSTYDR
jgi:hypothetical protein